MKLLAHQEDSKQFLLDKKRAILADQPRVGKTLPTAAAAAMHLPAIVVCPSIAKTVWERAFNVINPDLKVTVINGKQEAQAIARCDVVVINYDVVQHVTPTIYNKFCTLVLDESHRIKSPDAKRTKVCMAMMREIERVYALSGTPIPNRPIELWPLLNGLGIYRNGYYEFAARYARMWKAPWGLDVSGSSNLPELKALMQPHVLRRRKEDVFTDYNEPSRFSKRSTTCVRASFGHAPRCLISIRKYSAPIPQCIGVSLKPSHSRTCAARCARCAPTSTSSGRSTWRFRSCSTRSQRRTK